MHRQAGLLVAAVLACAGMMPAHGQQREPARFPPPRGMRPPPPPPPPGMPPPRRFPPPPPPEAGRAPATLPATVPIVTAPAPERVASDPVRAAGSQPQPPTTALRVAPAPAASMPNPAASAPMPTRVAGALPAEAGAAPGSPPESRKAPTWPWLVLLAALAAAWWTAWRHSQRLKAETERLARQQRVLKSAHSHLQRKSEKLQHLSMHDPLTGTLNRQAFGAELRDRIDHLSKYGQPLSLIVFDLDHFKQINDRHGHLVGDAALALVVGVVREHLVSDDLFGRFGGDEFMIASPGQDAARTLALAETLRLAVAARAPHADPPVPGLTLSLGVAQADPDQGYQLDELFARADAALYVAKQRGRNHAVAADETMMAQRVPGTVRRHL